LSPWTFAQTIAWRFVSEHHESPPRSPGLNAAK